MVSPLAWRSIVYKATVNDFSNIPFESDGEFSCSSKIVKICVSIPFFGAGNGNICTVRVFTQMENEAAKGQFMVDQSSSRQASKAWRPRTEVTMTEFFWFYAVIYTETCLDLPRIYLENNLKSKVAVRKSAEKKCQ